MTLIEVLIALVLLVTSILGAVAMQASAKKGSFDAMQRSLASSLAQDIIERMRGNNVAVLDSYAGNDYGKNVDLDAAENINRCDDVNDVCDFAELATNDLFEWEVSLIGANITNDDDNKGGLVGAVGCISHNNGNVVVAVSWEGREETLDGAIDTSCGEVSTRRRQILVNAFIN